jgi:hypothetical protein
MNTAVTDPGETVIATDAVRQGAGDRGATAHQSISSNPTVHKRLAANTTAHERLAANTTAH